MVAGAKMSIKSGYKSIIGDYVFSRVEKEIENYKNPNMKNQVGRVQLASIFYQSTLVEKDATRLSVCLK